MRNIRRSTLLLRGSSDFRHRLVALKAPQHDVEQKWFDRRSTPSAHDVCLWGQEVKPENFQNNSLDVTDLVLFLPDSSGSSRRPAAVPVQYPTSAGRR